MPPTIICGRRSCRATTLRGATAGRAGCGNRLRRSTAAASIGMPSSGLRSTAVSRPARCATMRRCAWLGVTSTVTDEKLRSSPLSFAPGRTWRPVAITSRFCRSGTVASCSASPCPLAEGGRAVSSRSMRSPGCSMPEMELISSTEMVSARMPGLTRDENTNCSADDTAAVESISPGRMGSSRRWPTRASNCSGVTTELDTYSAGTERMAIVSPLTISPLSSVALATTTSTICWATGARRSRSAWTCSFT